MPVAEGPKFDARRAIVAGVAAVAAGIGLIVLVSQLAGTGTVEVQLGDDRFEDIGAAALAREIAERGPVLFPDAGTGTRDIIIQHLGSAPQDGWLAFDARLPGRPRECTLQWIPAGKIFVDACDDSLTVPADGGDLTRYRVEVVDGELIVDIAAEAVEPGSGE